MSAQDLDKQKPRQRRKLSEVQWQVILEDWRLSGLSKIGYCKLQGITPSCFARWHQRLSVGQIDPASGSSSVESLSSLLSAASLSSPASPPSDRSVKSAKVDSDKADTVWSSFIPVRVDDVAVGTVPGLKLDVRLLGGTRVCVEGVLWPDVLQLLSRSMRC